MMAKVFIFGIIFLQKKNNHEYQSTKVYDVTSDHYLTGETDFGVEEVEIYQILFK